MECAQDTAGTMGVRVASAVAAVAAVAVAYYAWHYGRKRPKKRSVGQGSVESAAIPSVTDAVATRGAAESSALTNFDVGAVLADIPRLDGASAAALVGTLVSDSATAADRVSTLVTVANAAAVGSGSQAAVRDAGGLEAVMRLVSSRNDDERLAALRAFANLAVNETNQDTLFAGIPAIARLLDSARVDVVIAACRCLLNMSVRDDFHHVVRRTAAAKSLNRLIQAALQARRKQRPSAALVRVSQDYYERRPVDACMYEAVRVAVNMACNSESARWLADAGVFASCVDVALDWPATGAGMDGDVLQKAAATIGHVVAAHATAPFLTPDDLGRATEAVDRLALCDDSDAREFAVRASLALRAIAHG